MGDISNLISNEGANVIDADIKVRQNLADMRLIVEVRDVTQLSRILARIENLPNISEAHRINPG